MRSQNNPILPVGGKASGDYSKIMQDTTETRLQAVKDRITRAAKTARRPADTVSLVAVSKRQSEARIEEVLAAGQRRFGENRVQEAQSRWEPRRPRYADLLLHLIGPLQTNKARDAVALFDVIEIVDRPKLAMALANAMADLGRRPRLFIQVNTGAEPQKSGVAVHGLADLLSICRRDCGLEIHGLMCIPPVDEPPAPHFALLSELAAEYRLPHVSMGMTSDFETAIHQGATEVRVGTAIFGPRED